MLEIVWRNPRPPARKKLRVAEVAADESTASPMWVISYRTIVASGRLENVYELVVKRILQGKIAI
jgi:hypothetical protein